MGKEWIDKLLQNQAAKNREDDKQLAELDLAKVAASA